MLAFLRADEAEGLLGPRGPGLGRLGAAGKPGEQFFDALQFGPNLHLFSNPF
jgi:hypothetical protein